MPSTSTCPAADHGLASSIKRRSFSLLLARRYLNPRRSMLSSFSIISLLGVMLGVLVLVVVMAIYAGLERNVKSRLLGFTPHVSANFHDPASLDGRMTNWQEAASKLRALPQVEAATAYVSDNVIIDYQSWQRPVLFRGIDTSDPAQVEGITKMLDLKLHPSSTADLGIDDRVVISSILAEQLQLSVGDEIRLLSTRNIEGVMRAYKSTENPLIRDAFKDSWARISNLLTSAWKSDGDGFTLTFESYREVYKLIDNILIEDIRTPERALLESILIAMDTSEKVDASELFSFTSEAKITIEKSIADLNSTDMESMDAETLKNLKSVVLPKEAKVVGIYQASQMAVTPDIFTPLPLAQDLAGLGDSVQGIALRLENPYNAEIFATAARNTLGLDWSLVTWGQQYQAFFALIEQQRGMMYFMLSFIILISAFSMMAVMFTVTIQKRREIGVMKALGATPGQIVRVFLYQGMILGTLGAILGVGLGRLVILQIAQLRPVFLLVHRIRHSPGLQRPTRAGDFRPDGLRALLTRCVGARLLRRAQRCCQIPPQSLTHGHLDHSRRRENWPSP
jgi:lipoprotein-releasing system permease protein